MQFKFNINMREMTAEVNPKSLAELYELPPVARADLLKDILFEMANLYDQAVASLFSKMAN